MTTLRTLMVEDAEDDALLIARSLRQHGLEIDSLRVATREALLEALAEGQWDLAILDHNLPGFSGLQALEILQQQDFEGPVITVSGTIGEETAVECMRAGAHDYVMKDNLARLGPAVERELRDAQVRRDRRRDQQALAASEERYRNLVETMGDGVHM
ncbi:MAG: response regulator, partial [Armatimonadota bacterium]